MQKWSLILIYFMGLLLLGTTMTMDWETLLLCLPQRVFTLYFKLTPLIILILNFVRGNKCLKCMLLDSEFILNLRMFPQSYGYHFYTNICIEQICIWSFITLNQLGWPQKVSKISLNNMANSKTLVLTSMKNLGLVSCVKPSGFN